MGMPGSDVYGNLQMYVNRKKNSSVSAILKIYSATVALKIKAVYFFNVKSILCIRISSVSLGYFIFFSNNEIGELFLSKVKSSDPFYEFLKFRGAHPIGALGP